MSDNKKKRMDKDFVVQKPPKAPKKSIKPVKGFVPTRSPKPPSKNYKMP